MAEWRERRIPLRDTTLAVRERPGHGPVVVFEAGLGLPGSSWQPVCDRLPRDQAVLCYDRAGLGTSDPGPAPRTAPVLRSATRGDRADLFGAALSPGHMRGTLAEDRAYAATVAELRRAAHGRTLPDVPLRVISAEKTTGLRKLHRALAATGPQGVQVIAPGSGHLVMLDAPELVAAQIGELIRRGGTP